MGPRDALERLRALWNAQGVWVRGAVLAGALVVALLVLWAALRAREPRLEPLFTDLRPEDAATIVARLEKEQVPYRLEDGGRTVLVPRDQVHRLRLAFAAEGLPTGGVLGFELFDQSRFGDTEFDRRVRLLRALQGELARTIQEIEGVEAARVHIVLPEPSLFLSEQKPASAAVLLKLRPGVQLAPEQVRAVVNLVAGSVEGLRPENVTVVDVQGRVLSDRAAVDGERLAAASALQVQREVETRLQQGLQSLLEQVLGPGNVVTRVAAELNLDRLTVERELFEPAQPEGVMRSVRELRERFDGAAPVGGAPGTDGNVGAIPTYPIGSTGQGGSYQRDEVVRNFELNRIREHRVVAPGTVKRLSVSVVVNRTLTPEQEQAVRQVVAAAIGYDPNRSDQIAVIGMPFDTSLAEELQRQLAEERQRAGAARPLPAWAAALAGALVALALAAWILARRRARREAARLEEELALRLEQERRRLAELAVKGDGRSAAAADGQAELEQLVRQRPETVARVLRAWLAEE